MNIYRRGKREEIKIMKPLKFNSNVEKTSFRRGLLYIETQPNSHIKSKSKPFLHFLTLKIIKSFRKKIISLSICYYLIFFHKQEKPFKAQLVFITSYPFACFFNVIRTALKTTHQTVLNR